MASRVKARYPCCGCGRGIRAEAVTVCPVCDGFVCAACPASCPHREPEASQSTFLDFWAGDYGRYTSVTTDKE